MAGLNRVWWSNTISFTKKFKLYRSLVTSVFLHGCETWTLLADSEKKIQAFVTMCLRKLLRVSYLEHKTNDLVWSKINFLIGLQEPLLAPIKRRKLAWFGHLTLHNNLSKAIIQGTLEGGRHHGWQRNAEWTTWKTGHLCPCQNFPLEEDLCWIICHVPPTI